MQRQGPDIIPCHPIPLMASCNGKIKMNNMEPLNQKVIIAKLKELDGWELAGNAIEKEIRFSDFIETMSAMVQIAFYAESMNHHPEWSNVYNKLTIRLTTHDVGGITEKDIQLAGKINEITAS
jgi:4a-hydroxytetrahydrobiopterin dehydratase